GGGAGASRLGIGAGGRGAAAIGADAPLWAKARRHQAMETAALCAAGRLCDEPGGASIFGAGADRSKTELNGSPPPRIEPAAQSGGVVFIGRRGGGPKRRGGKKGKGRRSCLAKG